MAKTDDGLLLKSIGIITANGLVYKPEDQTWQQKGRYKITNLLNLLVSLISDKSDLTPESIGLERKIESKIFFQRNEEYSLREEMYKKMVIDQLVNVGYTVEVCDKIYGPYNYIAQIYLRIANGDCMHQDNGKCYVKLILETNANLFFDDQDDKGKPSLCINTDLLDKYKNNTCSEQQNIGKLIDKHIKDTFQIKIK